MSKNKVVVNDCEWLTWEVTDAHMHGLIEWLNDYATKVNASNKKLSTSGTIKSSDITYNSTLSNSGDLIVKGTIYCNNIRSLNEWCCQEDDERDLSDDALDALPLGVDILPDCGCNCNCNCKDDTIKTRK
jgi:hypothetical protein